MRCPNCGKNTPDNLPNCINCGKIISNYNYDKNVDYQQVYYKNKVDRQQRVKDGFNKAGKSVSKGVDNIQNGFNSFEQSFSQGVNDIERSVSNGINNVSSNFNNSVTSGTYQALKKKGDDAFIMGIVALVASFLGGTVISLVLGILAIIWGKQAYLVTNIENHKTAKILGIVAVVVSSLYIVGAIIAVIIEIVVAAGTYSYYAYDIFDGFEMILKLI